MAHQRRFDDTKAYVRPRRTWNVENVVAPRSKQVIQTKNYFSLIDADSTMRTRKIDRDVLECCKCIYAEIEASHSAENIVFGQLTPI